MLNEIHTHHRPNRIPLAIHYAFTHAELDFIINYDIKYRMGKELDTEEEAS